MYIFLYPKSNKKSYIKLFGWMNLNIRNKRILGPLIKMGEKKLTPIKDQEHPNIDDFRTG